MDLQHESDMFNVRMFLEQCAANVERANRNKGQTPRNHPPLLMLVQRFIMNTTRPQVGGQVQIAMSHIPEPYLPCTLPVKELQPIFISQMRLETHHRGRRVVVRVLTPPSRMAAVMTIVADEKGTPILLQLYHQPEEAVVPATKTLRMGRCYLIKDPFFKSATSDGSYSLRVDHVSDIVLLEDDDALVPKACVKPKLISGSSHAIRMQGNVAVRTEDWAEAEQLYTSAITAASTVEDEQLALLNRSLASLKLGRPASALMDAVKAGSHSDAGPSERGMFREASALYHLSKFDQCLKLLEALEHSYPSTKAAQPLISRVRARLHEQQTGAYNFRQMYKQARATPPLIDCATYSAPVEVLESPGRGRGLFTTRKVLAGDLLLCEKAFGYSYAGEDKPGSPKILINSSTKVVTMGGQADLITQVVQKLFHDPAAARSFVNLYHGAYEVVPSDTIDGRPVVDTFLVEKIISLTSFGAPRTTLEHMKRCMSNKSTEQDSGFDTCGVWTLASHINHSCMSNCRRSFIGDLHIVRATRDLDAGEELFFWYKHPDGLHTHKEAQEHLESWGFTCDCAMCLDNKSTRAEVILKRKSLDKEFKLACGKTLNVSKAQRVIDELEKTYSSAAKEPGAVRWALWGPYFTLGTALIAENKPRRAIESLLKGLEALGFVFTASPVKDSTRQSRASEQLQIKKWGLATDQTAQVFLMLSEAYQMVAPASSAAARRYMEVAYSLAVGEKETFADMYPGL